MRGVVRKDQSLQPASPRKPAAQRAVPAKSATARRSAESPESSAGGRLSRAHWIDAGEAVLCESGITGVKLATLTERLGVSIGSFYHHFTSFEHYLGELADNYSVERVRHELELASAGDLSPLDRIQRLRTVSNQLGTFELDRAMRVWATIDPRAEKTLRKAETLVLAFLRQAFCEMGFAEADALLRARILLSVNVVAVGKAESKTHATYLRDVLHLLAEETSRPSTPKAPKPPRR